MGMFDYIKAPVAKCLNCGATMREPQSKGGPCQLLDLDFWEVDNFYYLCDDCGVINYFNKKERPREILPFSAYEQSLSRD